MRYRLAAWLAASLIAMAPSAHARAPRDPSAPVYDWTDDLGREHHTRRKPTPSMMSAGLRTPRAHAPRLHGPRAPGLHALRPPRLSRPNRLRTH
jgi:hypothetical protein